MNIEVKKFQYEYRDSDPDEISEFYSRNNLRVKFKPLPGKDLISNTHIQFSSDEWQVWSCNCESGMSLTYEDTPKPSSIIYISRAGSMNINSGQRSVLSDEKSAMVTDMRTFETAILQPSREHLAVSFSNAAVAKQLSLMLDDCVTKEIVFAERFASDTGNGAHLISLLDIAWQRLTGPQTVTSSVHSHHLMAAIAALMLETIPNNYSASLDRPLSPAIPRNVKRAIDFMHANASRRITLEEITLASGTGARALQAAFQSFKDTTPILYLRSIRLRNAREALSDGTEYKTVSEAASGAGFTHLGRFSSIYLNAYGETPSETLSRSKN